MIWVDITNLPHVLFFEDFIKGHDTFVTSRDFWDLDSFLDSRKIEHTSVGRHGGKSREDKLKESSRRIEKLAGALPKNVDIAISKQSVELPRVAFGLDIPSVQFIDNEYAEKQNRIVLPLCSRIIVPLALQKERLIAQGATEGQILQVNCVFEASQIKKFQPDSDVPKEHGLDNYVVLRPEPYMASYYEGTSATATLIEKLQEAGRQVVVIPRGDEDYGVKTLRKADSLSLMYYADAVLSGGGTMTREAALLGTPAISYYSQELLGVDRFLIEKGLLEHSTDIGGIPDLLGRIVNKKEELRELAGKVINEMEDPFVKLEEEISNLAARSS